ncbi:uncharacterized protein BJ171DRAFT_489906 [Polychytrium aggregatum]|uniref:uncharacterized protein n=1 Tax=Polychytrium aggregatum TaxID=110093 RepID=UPI0022FE2BAD|nr:uncharacterized protein BJ171DRAFT_489906 [Polychytrium aggregatum]KAI9208765.1 hypothetical protein BJ171DRAFT_489906 [Polychytrium aggregatum]
MDGDYDGGRLELHPIFTSILYSQASDIHCPQSAITHILGHSQPETDPMQTPSIGDPTAWSFATPPAVLADDPAVPLLPTAERKKRPYTKRQSSTSGTPTPTSKRLKTEDGSLDPHLDARSMAPTPTKPKSKDTPRGGRKSKITLEREHANAFIQRKIMILKIQYQHIRMENELLEDEYLAARRLERNLKIEKNIILDNLMQQKKKPK